MAARSRAVIGLRSVVRVGVVVILLSACEEIPTTVSAPMPPLVAGAAVESNPHNAISAIVRVRVVRGDSVLVRFWLASDGNGTTFETPAVRAIGDSAVVPVLGLLPSTAYVMQPVAYGAGVTIGAKESFVTGALPPDIPRYTAVGPDPSPGYIVLAAGMYGLVLDNNGRVVWYRRFPDGPGLNFVANPNGRFAARPPGSSASDPGAWVEIDPLGTITRTLTCANGLRPRLHDLIAQPDGSYWLLCDETRTMDLSASGGVANAQVTGTVIQHVDPIGELLFSWSAFDHFTITDVPESERRGSTVNWTHGNSIDLDSDANVVVSFRNLNEITKIDARTGDVIWRMGGRRNEVAFTASPLALFAGQHSARALGGGHYLLLDNIGDPAQSRVTRLVIDERTLTARITQSYGSTPSVATLIGGSVQSLPGGRTLVSFGTAGRVEEIASDGQVVWRINGHAGYVFRAQRIRSLYAPGVGTTR